MLGLAGDLFQYGLTQVDRRDKQFVKVLALGVYSQVIENLRIILSDLLIDSQKTELGVNR